MTVYDFVAEGVSSLHSCDPIVLNQQLKNYNCISDETKQGLNENSVTRDLNRMSYYSLGKFTKFDLYWEQFKEKLKDGNFFMAFLWLQIADAIAEAVECGCNVLMGDVIERLNDEKQDEVLVFPRVRRKVFWKSHTCDEFSDNINQLFSHLLVVRVADLGGFTVVNHYSSEDSDFEFKIAGTPISNHITINIERETVNQVDCFSPRIAHEDIEAFSATLFKALNRWDGDGCKLIAFPELISTKLINEQIVSRLAKMQFNNIRYIALPTYYDSTEAQNIGDVYDTRLHKVLFSQYKITPFIYEDKSSEMHKFYKENIHGTKTLHLLHVPLFGVIVFPICRDILEEKYIDICREMHTNLAVTRACTSEGGIEYFKRIDRRLSSFECWLFVINSCCVSSDAINDVTTVGVVQGCLSSQPKIYTCAKNCDDCGYGTVI